MQPWPAAAFTESYRFEKGDKATGYIYNYAAIEAKRWLDETKVLNEALLGATLLSVGATVASLLF